MTTFHLEVRNGNGLLFPYLATLVGDDEKN
jgi:hypothetical protein